MQKITSQIRPFLFHGTICNSITCQIEKKHLNSSITAWKALVWGLLGMKLSTSSDVDKLQTQKRDLLGKADTQLVPGSAKFMRHMGTLECKCKSTKL